MEQWRSSRTSEGQLKLTTSAFWLWSTISPLWRWCFFFSSSSSSHLSSMFSKVLLGFLAGVWLLLGLLAAAPLARNGTSRGSPPPLLLVSFDGFRADYLRTFPMSNLKRFYSQGVLVKELNNIFVTKTFPNHYTLVTLPVIWLKNQSMRCVSAFLSEHNGNILKKQFTNEDFHLTVFF